MIRPTREPGGDIGDFELQRLHFELVESKETKY